jgi:cellobiose phosphorylase
MNLVGVEGQGESVWLAFFLFDVLEKFAPLARERADHEFADLCQAQSAKLREAIEANGWDGAWYRRAYFDSGEPLGSATNAECQIDSLPQSWAAISGAAEPKRMQEAMQSVFDRLVRKDLGVIQLFDPPFNHSSLEPGYIKGYVPGVRENGGQYTHAAVWTTMAFALLGETSKAWQCFDIINPIRHSSNQERMRVYKVEPYVLAADVYSIPPHQGRGGWTWYTGSAGWMYRLIVEVLLGLRLEGGSRLTFRPCVPAAWNKYRLTYRHHETVYRIELVIDSEPTHHVKQVLLDGVEQADKSVALADDRVEHQVQVRLGI